MIGPHLLYLLAQYFHRAMSWLVPLDHHYPNNSTCRFFTTMISRRRAWFRVPLPEYQMFVVHGWMRLYTSLDSDLLIHFSMWYMWSMNWSTLILSSFSKREQCSSFLSSSFTPIRSTLCYATSWDLILWSSQALSGLEWQWQAVVDGRMTAWF